MVVRLCRDLHSNSNPREHWGKALLDTITQRRIPYRSLLLRPIFQRTTLLAAAGGAHSQTAQRLRRTVRACFLFQAAAPSWRRVFSLVTYTCSKLANSLWL